jgi:hypothetical protein
MICILNSCVSGSLYSNRNGGMGDQRAPFKEIPTASRDGKLKLLSDLSMLRIVKYPSSRTNVGSVGLSNGITNA